MAGILENLNYAIDILEEEKKLEVEDIKRKHSRGELIEEIKRKGVVEQPMPYLKQSYPPLIRKAVTYATGIPIP